jgi:REP element-mobilizing transposase RayT
MTESPRDLAREQPREVRLQVPPDLVPEAAAAETFRAIAEEFGFWIEELAIEEDHVYVFLEFPPKDAIARVVGILKS